MTMEEFEDKNDATDKVIASARDALKALKYEREYQQSLGHNTSLVLVEAEEKLTDAFEEFDNL